MKWLVGSKDIMVATEAETALEAFEALRGHDPLDFGLLCIAQPVGKPYEDAIPMRTARLFGLWGDETTAKLFIARAVELGLTDTSATDLPSMRKKLN